MRHGETPNLELKTNIDLSGLSGLTTIDHLEQENQMRKTTANTLRTTSGQKATRKGGHGPQGVKNARVTGGHVRQYDFRRGGYRR